MVHTKATAHVAAEHTAPTRPGAWLGHAEVQTLIAAAGAAPSILNTQPWSFVVREATISLFADPSRCLSRSVDPVGRQLIISCGAALLNVRVAAAHLGRTETVRTFPDPNDPTLLAEVTFGAPDALRHPDARLYQAIRRRRTHRHPFEARAVPGATFAEIAAAAHAEHAMLHVLGRVDRRWLYELVAFSETALEHEGEYEAALGQWTAGGDQRQDGVPRAAFGSLPWGDNPPMRDFAIAEPKLHPPREPYPHDPCVAILSTMDDDQEAWLQAGQALQRLLLVSCTLGVAASFLNQPLDAPSIRQELTDPRLPGHAQMILRMGYASGGVSTPRRPVTDLIRKPAVDPDQGATRS
jgi:hypothetical protein